MAYINGKAVMWFANIRAGDIAITNGYAAAFNKADAPIEEEETITAPVAPTLSLEGDTLTITGEGAALFYLYVNAIKKLRVTATDGTAIVYLSTLGLEGGTYSIMATSANAEGVGSGVSNTVTYMVEKESGGNTGDGDNESGGGDEPEVTITAPTLEVTGDNLSITGEGAAQYMIYVDGTLAATSNATENAGTFDLATLGLANGVYSITAVSVTADGKASIGSEAVTYAVLVAPTLGLVGDALTVTGADQYKIYVDGTERATGSEAQFDLATLGLTDGTYTITATTVTADGYESATSDAVEYIVKALDAPIVTLNGSVLTITGEGAEYYGIYIDGEKTASIPVGSPTYDLATKYFVVGSYAITVTAGAMINKVWCESAHSEVVTYWVLAPDAPVISISAHKDITIEDDNNDTWNVYVDGVRRMTNYKAKTIACVSQIGKGFDLPIGEYAVTVRAVANGEESSASNAVIYKVELSDEGVPETPTITYLGYYDAIMVGYNSHHFKIEAAEKVRSYKYVVTGDYETSSELYPNGASGYDAYFTSAQLSFAYRTNGTYYVSFAVANRFGVYGEYSEPIQFITEDGEDNRPAPPTLSIDGDALSVTTSAAYDLRIYVDGVKCAYTHYNPSNTFFKGLTINGFGSQYVPDDGIHEITAKVKNYLGYWSDFSDPVYYRENAIYGQAKYGSVKYGGG